MNAPVLIVAKTRMKGLACIGGLRLDTYQGVRLLRADGSYPPGTTTYQVGQIWDIDFEQFNMLVPPHVEDILIFDQRLVGRQNDLHDFLGQHIKLWGGSPDSLFEHRLLATAGGSGYISRHQGLPSVSTGFWYCDHPLQRVSSSSGTRYFYPHASHVNNLAYVGYSPAIDVIPAGSIIRVSLARWWRPDDDPDMEERCYLQLSGWYIRESTTKNERDAANPKQRQNPSRDEELPNAVRRSNPPDAPMEYPRTEEAWTATEDSVVRQLVSIAENVDNICVLLQRHQHAVWARITKLGLKDEYLRHH